MPLREVAPPDRWAVLLGAEGPGLTADALAAGRHRVRIPMAAGVDSLNVATAAAVAFAQLTYLPVALMIAVPIMTFTPPARAFVLKRR